MSDAVKRKHIDDIIVNHSINHIAYKSSSDKPESFQVKKKEVPKVKETPARVDTIEVKLQDESEKKLNANPKLKSEVTKFCPKCGKPMIVRTARRGANAGQQFLGCSGFPNCRYIEKIDKGKQ